MRIVFVLCAVLLSGCASRTDALRVRFANDTGCAEREVTVVAQSNSRFNASGCGRALTYVCEQPLSSSASDCSSEREQAPNGPPPMRPSTPGDDPRMQRSIER